MWDEINGEFEELREEAGSKLGDVIYLAVRLEMERFLEEKEDEILQAVMDGIREGVSEAVEAVLERHPELLAIRRN